MRNLRSYYSASIRDFLNQSNNEIIGGAGLHGDNFAYVMLVRNGEIVSEPYIPVHGLRQRYPNTG